MTDDTAKPTGDPQNPWGLNSTPNETPIYEGHEIPVITEASSREDLLRYIRILEHRLDLTHVYMQRPKGASADVEDFGVKMTHDLPAEKRRKVPILDLVRVGQNQAERAAMLARGSDRVGCLEIGEALYKRQALRQEDDN